MNMMKGVVPEINQVIILTKKQHKDMLKRFDPLATQHYSCGLCLEFGYKAEMSKCNPCPLINCFTVARFVVGTNICDLNSMAAYPIIEQYKEDRQKFFNWIKTFKEVTED